MRWIVERCLAKDPEERYASSKDLARDLKSVRDHLSETSAPTATESAGTREAPRRRWLAPAVVAFVVGAGLALLAARSLGLFAPAQPVFQSLTFRSGAILTARFSPDAKSVIYGAAWDGNPVEIFTTRPESPDSKSLGLPSADLLAVSRTGDLAISLGWHPMTGFESSGRLARVPASGGAPRDVLESVEGATGRPTAGSWPCSAGRETVRGWSTRSAQCSTKRPAGSTTSAFRPTGARPRSSSTRSEATTPAG